MIIDKRKLTPKQIAAEEAAGMPIDWGLVEKYPNGIMPPCEDNIWMSCPTCEEEYQLPEGMEICPICGKRGLETI